MSCKPCRMSARLQNFMSKLATYVHTGMPESESTQQEPGICVERPEADYQQSPWNGANNGKDRWNRQDTDREQNLEHQGECAVPYEASATEPDGPSLHLPGYRPVVFAISSGLEYFELVLLLSHRLLDVGDIIGRYSSSSIALFLIVKLRGHVDRAGVCWVWIWIS